jgi:hypothetical protein
MSVSNDNIYVFNLKTLFSILLHINKKVKDKTTLTKFKKKKQKECVRLKIHVSVHKCNLSIVLTIKAQYESEWFIFQKTQLSSFCCWNVTTKYNRYMYPCVRHASILFCHIIRDWLMVIFNSIYRLENWYIIHVEIIISGSQIIDVPIFPKTEYKITIILTASHFFWTSFWSQSFVFVFIWLWVYPTKVVPETRCTH